MALNRTEATSPTHLRSAGKCFLLLCLAGLAGFSSVATAQIIQNGSFEAPAVPDGTFERIAPTLWNGGAALLNPDATGRLVGSVATWPQPADGQQYADIGQLQSTPLSQSFTLATAGDYVISWQDNAAFLLSPSLQPAPYSVALVDGSSQEVFVVKLDAYHADGNWQTRSVTQTLLQGQYELIFTPLSMFNANDSLIDVVAISAVPEVGTGGLMILGACGLYVFARGRRRIGMLAPN